MRPKKSALKFVEDSQFPGVRAPIEPLTIRLPRSGERCLWTGLTRSALNVLILPCKANGIVPPVKSKVLKSGGNSRGIRLVIFKSLKFHLLEDEEGN